MKLVLTLVLLSAQASGQPVASEPPWLQRMAPLGSVIVPGTGELIRGYPGKGEAFLWAEGFAVTGAAGFGWDAYRKREAAISLAVLDAGSSPSNRSREYLAALENYASSEAYNQDVAREARQLFPDDFAARQEYVADNGFTGDEAWEWESDSLMSLYVEQRRLMRVAWQASQVFMGVMVLNRLASVFDVAFFSPLEDNRWGVAPTLDSPGLKFTWRF